MADGQQHDCEAGDPGQERPGPAHEVAGLRQPGEKTHRHGAGVARGHPRGQCGRTAQRGVERAERSVAVPVNPATFLSDRSAPAMLKWAIIFFVISLVAGALGFTNVASGARGIARLLFILFLVIAVVIVIAAVLLGQAVF